MPAKSSKSTSKTTAKKPVVAKRAPKSREQQLANSANTYAAHKFGAAVTPLTIVQIERAMKAAKLNRSHFTGKHRDLASQKQIDDCCRGLISVSALPSKTRANLNKLRDYAQLEEKRTGNVPKLWPKKCLIALRAIQNEKTRKPSKPKSAPAPTPVETTTVIDA